MIKVLLVNLYHDTSTTVHVPPTVRDETGIWAYLTEWPRLTKMERQKRKQKYDRAIAALCNDTSCHCDTRRRVIK